MSDSSERLSIRAYARRRGVSHVAVLKAVKAGRITLFEGKIDPILADRQWEANTNAGQEAAGVAWSRTEGEIEGLQGGEEGAPPPEGGPPGGGEGGNGRPTAASNYAIQRAIREGYLARLAKIEFELKTGKLVEADAVRVKAFNCARKARDMLLGLPDRLAPILAGEGNGFEVHRILSEEIRKVCDEISKAKPV